MAWFAAVMAALDGSEPGSAAHLLILLLPILLCGAIQFALTRNAQLTRGRRALQVGVAALLAPVLATTAIWLALLILPARH
jgi:hypothetical protein